jgi:hypothetical protein
MTLLRHICLCKQRLICSVTSLTKFSYPHDTKHNDIQHNDIQYNDIQHNDTQYNDIQHNDIRHNKHSL